MMIKSLILKDYFQRCLNVHFFSSSLSLNPLLGFSHPTVDQPGTGQFEWARSTWRSLESREAMIYPLLFSLSFLLKIFLELSPNSSSFGSGELFLRHLGSHARVLLLRHILFTLHLADSPSESLSNSSHFLPLEYITSYATWKKIVSSQQWFAHTCAPWTRTSIGGGRSAAF